MRPSLVAWFPSVGMAGDAVAAVAVDLFVFFVHLLLIVAAGTGVTGGAAVGMAGGAVSIGTFVIDRE